MKILYVEDEIPHVELTRRTLEDNLKKDLVLLHSESYKDAVKLINDETDIDIVLTDLRLPDGSGLDLLREIRKLKSPPAVVLVTGQGDEQIAVAALKSGAADYLVKQSDYLHRLPIVITNSVAQHKLELEQAAKLEAEIRYQSLVEQTPAVVFLDDAEENESTLYINPRVEELTGFTPEEWKSDEFIWENHLHPDDKERISYVDKDTHRTGNRFEEEYRFIRRDGKTIWIKENTNLIRDNKGNPLFWQGIMIDITKEKETAAALERQLKELTVLNAVTLAGAEGASEDHIIERIVNLTALIFNEVNGILLLNEGGDTLTPHPSYRGAAVENWQQGISISQGVSGRCVSTGKIIRLGDVSKDPDFIEIATGMISELCVPIRVNKRVIGVFNVESAKLDAYDKEDEQFLTTVAGSLGTALERLRLFKQEQQRNRELNTLYMGTRALTLSLKPNIIGENLLSILDDLLGYEFASIYLLDKQQNVLIPLAINPNSKKLDIYEKDMEMLRTEQRELGQGIIGWVAKHGEPIRSGDVSKVKQYLPVIKNIQSELCVPLLTRDQVIGAINIETTIPNAYTISDENLLSALANSAAIALENAQLYEAADMRRREAESLQEATAALSLHIELEPLLHQILESAFLIVPFDSASIFLENKSTKDMTIAAVKGFSENEIVGKVIPKSAKWHELALTHKALVLPDAQADPLFEKWDGSDNIRGWMGVPMITLDNIVGYINLDSHKINTYTERDATLIQTFANSAAVAIQNAILFNTEREQLKREETMLEMMRVTTSLLELDDVMQTILRHMASLIPSDSGTIQLLEGDELRIAAAQGFEFENKILAPGQMLKLKDYPINRKALSTKQPIWTNNTQDDHDYKVVIGAENVNSFMAIPLVYKGEAIGLATLDSHIINRYTPEDADFALAIANQAAIAIGNAKLYREALMASERRAVLHGISQDIVRFTQDQEQIYTSIHKAAEKLMPCDVFMITIHNETSNKSAFVYTMENGQRYALENQPSSEGLPGLVINMGKSIILENEHEVESKGFPRFGSDRHVNSAVAVPMYAGDKIIGMISAQSYLSNSYSAEEQSLLEMLATHAATAIENTRLYTETQRRLKELETVNKLSSSLRTTQSQTEMCNILLDETLELLRANDGAVWIYSSSRNEIIQRAAKGMTKSVSHRRLKPDEGIVGHVFSNGSYHLSPDVKNDPLLFDQDRNVILDGYAGVSIPIYSTDGILGVLMIQAESSHKLENRISLLETLAEIAGNAIHRADLFDQSQDQVHKLTTLRDIDSAIASSTDLQVTLNILMDHTQRHLKVDAVAVLLYHPELQSLSYLCSSGFNTSSPSRPLVRVGEGLAGQAVMKGSIVQISDIKESTEAPRDPILIRERFVSYIGVPLIVKGQIKGLFEIFHRSQISPDHEWMQFMHTLTGQAAIAIDNSQLFDNLQRSNQEIRQAYDTTLEGWARALELRDRETEGHTRRVTELTMRLAHFMNIGEDELVNINRGVLLHDIGKMGVPDQILRKTGPLTDTEWLEMRKHPQYAYDLLSPIPYLRPALDIPYCHHEHWDGSGYPRGLKGTQIPLSARIFSIVDIWDALLSDRPYRKAWPREKVLEYLKEVSGSILDPTVVETFLRMLSEDDSS